MFACLLVFGSAINFSALEAIWGHVTLHDRKKESDVRIYFVVSCSLNPILVKIIWEQENNKMKLSCHIIGYCHIIIIFDRNILPGSVREMYESIAILFSDVMTCSYLTK